MIKTLDDLDAALKKRGQRLLISGDSVLYNNMARVIPLAAATGKPTLGAYTDWSPRSPTRIE
ncbi:hypothetical protein JQ596_09325 [Bradyrhizobium manausense]|uniref:hypothetical protein n=1 Tax=Bradyrhizobium TaxID=374 RepID=UPI001BAAC0A3|nr:MULTISPECIES: hypothetical protein [Bradyrhizobium]MBR0825738.1 hypothetical protein [Bradyrhizobium manausense]UVO31316.1 hypothetical protein KUF59_12025 [Bradyrhizobium arachidis]